MKRRTLLLPILLTVGWAYAKDYHVVYLGGQSNMDGYGLASELPETLTNGVDGVWIFHGNMGKDGMPPDGRGLWQPLKAGHGRNFASNGSTNTYSDRFGVELTLSTRLRELFPHRNIALIKYSRGGTALDPEAPAANQFGCWDPVWDGGEGEGKGINQYDHFLATVANAWADDDIDDDGEPDTLIPAGILWMQGESDATGSMEIAERYAENLAHLMSLIREAFASDELPIVVGRITDWKVWTHGTIVRAEQASFVEKDGNAALVTSTDNYNASDKWHYDTAGYLDLGERFAEALAGLMTNSP